MAYSDYVINGSGRYVTIAQVSGDVGQLDTAIYFSAFRQAISVLPQPGDIVLIGDELMSLVAFTAGKITVARGCIDTIPATHVTGDTIWFIDNSAFGTNRVTYTTGEEIGVKVLPRTTSAVLAIENAPPEGLLFRQRFYRPYAPGNVIVNSLPWYTGFELLLDGDALELSWAHRNRVTQGDQLVGHTEASIPAEAGTTYTIRIYDANEPNVLVAEHTGITDPSFTYTYLDAVNDFVPSGGLVELEPSLLDVEDVGADMAVVYDSFVYAQKAGVVHRMAMADLSEPVAALNISANLMGLLIVHDYLLTIDAGDTSTGVFGKLRKYDSATLVLSTSVSFPALGDGFGGMAYCPGSLSLWINLANTGYVRRVHPDSLATVANIALVAARLCADDTYVYALGSHSAPATKRIYRINPATNAVINTWDITSVDYTAPQDATSIFGATTGTLWLMTNDGLKTFNSSTGVEIDNTFDAALDGTLSFFTDQVCVVTTDGEIVLIDGLAMEIMGRTRTTFLNQNEYVAATIISDSLVLADKGESVDFLTLVDVDPDSIASEILLTLHAERDGVESWSKYEITSSFAFDPDVQPYGLGYRLGQSLGGIAP